MNLVTESMISTISDWIGTGSVNLFGMQLSGKDTQGENIAKLFNAPLIGGGEILRNSKIPKKIQQALDQGRYIDSSDYVNVITPYFEKPEFAGKPLVLSSVGRWIGEEESIIEATKIAGHPIKVVIELKIDESVAYARLEKANRGRNDDHVANVKNRIEEFKQKTVPVIEKYRSMGLLITVNGNKEPDAVLQDILNELYTRATA